MCTLIHLLDWVARELQDSTTRLLHEYFPCGLSQKQRSKIELDLIKDEASYQDLLAAEDALVQDYIRGVLPSADETRVAALAQTSREWADKIRFARATKIILERNAKHALPVNNIALVEATYEALTALAKQMIAHERDETFEPADLVSEVYIRMTKSSTAIPHDKVEFSAMAARVMRRVLVDVVRERRAMQR